MIRFQIKKKRKWKETRKFEMERQILTLWKNR